MDALLMCGGQGTRLAEGHLLQPATEKPLVEVCRKPMIDRVLGALDSSRVDHVLCVTSPHVPNTASHLDALLDDFARSTPTDRFAGPGEGYVADLDAALDRIEPPVLTVACDLPLLASTPIDRVLAAHTGSRSLSVCVPAALKRRLGVSTDATWTPADRELAPTGLNVVASDTDKGESATTDSSNSAPDETRLVSYDARLAVNVNRPADLAVAEALCE